MLPHIRVAPGAIISMIVLVLCTSAHADARHRHFHSRAIFTSNADSTSTAQRASDSSTYSMRKLRSYFQHADVERLSNGAAVVTFPRIGSSHPSVAQSKRMSRPFSSRLSACQKPTVQRFLRKFRGVVDCNSDYEVRTAALPNDSRTSELWGLSQASNKDIDAPAAWDVTTGSRDVLVAVIDSGVQTDHPDLAANMWVNPLEIANNNIDDDGNGVIDDVHGYNAADDNGNPSDDNGHGTHCAGTIGGVGNNGVGITGVNWEVSIVAVKFIDSSGSGTTSDAVKAIDYVTALKEAGHNVVASSNSWGGAGSSTSLQNAIARANSAGVLFIAAAGNEGLDIDAFPSYPASYTTANVISVAAIGRDGELAYYSNYGSTSVDIAAPGGSAEGDSSDILSTYIGSTYEHLAGTSMATPHVAGAVALIKARYPELSAASVKSAILNGSKALSSLSGAVSTGALLNLSRALSSASGGSSGGGSGGDEDTSTLDITLTGPNEAGKIVANSEFSISIQGATAGAGTTLVFTLDGRTCAGSYSALFDESGALNLNGRLNKSAGRSSGLGVYAYDDNVALIAEGAATINRASRTTSALKANKKSRKAACRALINSLS